MRCPNCGGFLIREPASVRCVACGCRWEIFDADDAARLKQRLLDASPECNAANSCGGISQKQRQELRQRDTP
jgi:hypothetical protein